MFRLFYILENCISKYIKKGQMQRGIAAENCGYAFLLCQGPVFIVEFFVDPKNGTLKTKKPPAR